MPQILKKASLELIRRFISEEEEQILLKKYKIEFVSYDEYETLDELIEAWKKAILDLKICFAFHEDNPIFNPLRKYIYTYLRDKILQTKYPDFSDDVIVLDERVYYEKVILDSIFKSSIDAFIIDITNPYLYKFFDYEISEDMKLYLSDLSERDSIFQNDEDFLSESDISKTLKIVKDKNSKKEDKYFSFDETKWFLEMERIFSIIFNPYVNASYAKSKEKTDKEKEFFKFAESLCKN